MLPRLLGSGCEMTAVPCSVKVPGYGPAASPAALKFTVLSPVVLHTWEMLRNPGLPEKNDSPLRFDGRGAASAAVAQTSDAMRATAARPPAARRPCRQQRCSVEARGF